MLDNIVKEQTEALSKLLDYDYVSDSEDEDDSYTDEGAYQQFCSGPAVPPASNHPTTPSSHVQAPGSQPPPPGAPAGGPPPRGPPYGGPPPPGPPHGGPPPPGPPAGGPPPPNGPPAGGPPPPNGPHPGQPPQAGPPPPPGGPPPGPGGAVGGGIPQGVPFGPVPQAQRHPHPDPIVDNRMRHQKDAAIAALNHPFTNRDVRHIMAGGAPRDPGTPAYLLNNHWEHYINRLLFPQFLSELEIKVFYSVTHQELYSLVEKFAVPFIATGGPTGGVLRPHRMTPDALMCLLLFKCHENLSDRLIGALFGESGYAANYWIRGLRDFIYQTDDWLIRGRNLSDNRLVE